MSDSEQPRVLPLRESGSLEGVIEVAESLLLLANTRAGPRAGATPASFGSRYSMRTRSTCSPSFRSDSAGGTKPVVRCFRPPRTDTELRATPMTGQFLV
jgi:hypothetical protein